MLSLPFSHIAALDSAVLGACVGSPCWAGFLGSIFTHMIAAVTALLAASTAYPTYHGFAVPSPDTCTGSGAPHREPPACYQGKASVLGGAFSESVIVNIKEFDFKTNKGKMDINAQGASPEQCSNLDFEKNGMDIKFDSSIACLGGVAVKVQYCSDQDQVIIHISIPHLPIVALPVTLTTVKCP